MIVPTYILSSNLDAIGYKKGRLYIRFQSGQVYQYSGVPFTVFNALKDAESAGQYFHKNVRTTFPYEKLSSDPFSDAIKKAA